MDTSAPTWSPVGIACPASVTSPCRVSTLSATPDSPERCTSDAASPRCGSLGSLASPLPNSAPSGYHDAAAAVATTCGAVNREIGPPPHNRQGGEVGPLSEGPAPVRRDRQRFQRVEPAIAAPTSAPSAKPRTNEGRSSFPEKRSEIASTIEVRFRRNGFTREFPARRVDPDRGSRGPRRGRLPPRRESTRR